MPRHHKVQRQSRPVQREKIVATAKELTVDEKARLQGQIQSLMQKGDFLNDEFLEEVRSLIR